MSIKKLFQNNSQAITVSKYLKKSTADSLGDGIESRQHLSESLKKRDRYIPPVNYNNPEEFVKYGSAQKYYDNAFDYVRDYYPYDGSRFEVDLFENELNPLENFIFSEYYPTSTGYINLGNPYGSSTSDASGYFSSSVTQYVRTKGGPHSGTVYSDPSYRTSNLEFGGPSGSTVEFFFQKGTGIPSSGQSEKQVIFDLWNSNLSSSHDYGRMRIEIFSGSEDRFKVTMMSGTTGFFTQSVPTTGGLSSLMTSGSWHNYGFVFNTSGSGIPYIDFYIDGACVETNITASGHQAGVIRTVTGSLISNIGSLRYAVSGTKDSSEAASLLGYGQLSASLDEFRFWKKSRNAEEIGQNWFTEVYGGADNYDANVSLGVYYKFNEGLTLTSSIDEVVLDYSGRISNGLYIGYNSDYSRNTGSAINDMNLTSVFEMGDPIIRSSNPTLLSQKNYFSGLGRQYDYTNSSYMMNMVPSWIYEEDENNNGELANLNQILSSYLDTLNIQISELSKIKDIRYASGSLTGSINEFPYNDRLLSSLGMAVPEIFEDIGVLGQLLQRDEQIEFDQPLVSIKNAIYKNIYNNLEYIFKAKGNEKSIRNLIRCYGIDENILDLSVYSDNEIYDLNTKYYGTVSDKKYIDFSGLNNQESSAATVYQYYDGEMNSFGIITGSSELDSYGFTLEAEFVFPNKKNFNDLSYEPPHVVTSSLFGFHTPADTDPTAVDTTWANIGNATYSDQGFQIYAVKSPSEYAEVLSPDYLVKDVYFEVKDSSGNTLITTDVYQNVYENERWNFSLSLRNEKYPFANQVDGAESGVGGTTYTLSLYGVNYDTGIKRNSFYKTASLTHPSGSQSLTFPKKLYVGAHRTNFSGSILEYSDVRASSVRYWSQVLPTGTIDSHARDVDNYGHLNPYQQAYSFQGSQIPQVYIPNIETLALNWDFANIQNADSSGVITVSDFSSGSNGTSYEETYQGTVFTNVNKRQLRGRGEFFAASDSAIVKQFPYTEKQQLPEYVLSRDMIEVKSSDVEVFRQNQKVNNFYFSIEKSPYKSISKRMLQFFASLDEMSNLIGEPVSAYRYNYKRMEKLREVFFRRVGNVPDFDKYAEYYKWIDYAMGQIAAQLFPASSKHTLGTRTVIENHLLERPKYRWNYIGNRKKHLSTARTGGTPETRKNRTTDSEINSCPDKSGWRFSHAPLNLEQSASCNWWKYRAHRSLPAFGVTDTGVIATRTAILSASHGYRKDSRIEFPPAPNEIVFEDGLNVTCLKANLNAVKVGGINQSLNKHRNLLTGTFDSFSPLENCVDVLDPFAKTKIPFRGTINGRDYKGEEVMPFSAYSSSLSPDTSGYWNYLNSKGLVNIDLSNLHEDSVYPFGQSVPMQGPFTREHVGGYKSRHVNPLRTFERSEKYSLSISSGTGSIEIYTTNVTTPKGHYLRGLASKSPVNIANILTTTGSSIEGSGVNVLGNFSKNYEVVQTVDRSKTNMDFVFNNENYNNGASVEVTGAIPSAFIIPPNRRVGTGAPGDGAEGLSFKQSGSADYAAPRQISTRRVNQSIFVNQFSAPGSILDAKQQYRDVASDQLSPNNALPFRNTMVRRLGNLSHRNQGTGLGAGAGLHGFLRLFTGWGGFQQDAYNEIDAVAGELSVLNSGEPYPIGVDKVYGLANITNIPSGSFVALHKTQRNTTRRLQISGTYANITTLTASNRDNAFVVRPIPSADRTQWFQNLSGSNTDGSDLFSNFFLSSSRYPLEISLITSSLSDTDVARIGTDPIYSSSAGSNSFIWSDSQTGAPWSQLRMGYKNEGSYFNKNLIYNISPKASKTGQNSAREIFVGSYEETNRTGQSERYDFYRRFKEPPVTSKYRPFVNKIKAFPGSPTTTSKTDTVDVAAKYSYGNYLQSFANKELNTYTTPSSPEKHYSFREKRPYEIMRNNFVENLPPSVTGIDMHKQMLYSEVVYPREVYTYLSESRSRLAFINTYWKNDVTILSNDMSSFTSYYQLTDYDAHSTGITNNIASYNRQINRISGNFMTSQGYATLGTDQIPYNSLTAGSVNNNPGSGSIWPMDSYLYSDSIETLKSVVTGSSAILLADASTMAAGELMMLNYGTVDDGMTDSLSTNASASWNRNSSVSTQYMYSVPAVCTSSIAITAVAATAAITASIFEGQPNAAATGEIEFGISADGDTVNGNRVEIPDGVTTFEFQFDNTVVGNSFSSPDFYVVGTSDGSGGVLSGADLRDALYNAIDDSTTTPSIPLGIKSPTTSGDYIIQLEAGTPGTGFNSNTITQDTAGGSTGISVTGFSDGTDYSLNGLTLILEDETQTDTYNFDNTVNVASSNATTIGCSDATSTNLVATAIYTSINAAQGAGNINITPDDPGGLTNIVALTADDIGAGMNGKTIVGTFITDATNYGEAQPFAGGVSAGANFSENLPDPLQPGGAYTRPAWTAGSERKYVDGVSKGALNNQQYPFYNTYDEYVQDAKAAAKEYTIIPEFRISELILDYQNEGTLFNQVRKTLEITGANHTNYNPSVNTDFIPRYATSDLLEYLDPLMVRGTVDNDFLKSPRQFGFKSHAVIKMLPYDGFYPQLRTMQISTLFSQSYADASAGSWGGESGSAGQRWRTLHRPFFAPGILYNSVKSGIGVEYPVWRGNKTTGSFMEASAYTPLAGALSGTLNGSSAVAGQIPGNRRRRVDGDNNNFDFTDIGVNKFFWSDKLPFEAILKPMEYISDNSENLRLSDINPYLINDISGSVSTTGSINDLVYRLAVSNFLGAVPEFFLRRNNDGTSMTKFVAKIPASSPASPEGSAPVDAGQPRRVRVEPKTAYVMEVGIRKTEMFNLYNNPYAFGIPTSTGSVDWQSIVSAGNTKATREQDGCLPSGLNWPLHRAEFAPFTPPYYYGDSKVRIIYIPNAQREVSLKEILESEEIYTEFVNENGQYFDFASGSFVLEDGSTTTVSDYPPYQWNRAWKNRMDIDASIVIDNIFPTEAGNLSPLDQNKWVIMPKWECPVLDFSGSNGSYNFSSSIEPTEYSSPTYGMWHQYGVEPNTNEGVFMYLSDVGIDDLEYRLIGNPQGSSYDPASPSVLAASGRVRQVKKLPKYVFDQGVSQVKSLAKLVGFNESEIMPPNQWMPERAKRIGQIAENNEKSISEAVLAIPFWYDSKDEEYVCMTMTADSNHLGPRIKEFRRAFTKYSLPPALKKSLMSMIPPDYPDVSQVIVPFGDDDYEKTFASMDTLTTPIVYLFEHTIDLTKQDLADIWQGIMPDISKNFKMSVSSIDHYMPGERIEEEQTVFPEILKKQLDLGIPQTGHPRVDLIDVTGDLNGFNTKIRWMVFKVKQRGPTSYYETIFNEINDGPGSLSFQNLFGYLSDDLSPQLREAIERQKDNYTTNMYISENLGEYNNTFNWPYDYCSLIELGKLEATTGFRPELKKEVAVYRGESNVVLPALTGDNAGGRSNLPRSVPNALQNLAPLQRQNSQILLQSGDLSNLSPLLDISYQPYNSNND